MFTGIISQIGQVTHLQSQAKEILLELQIVSDFEESYSDVKVGESIAVNGTCLTATEIKQAPLRICFFISPETFEKTNLKYLKRDSKINLERAMRFSDRLSGHLVQGHVDSLAKLTHLETLGNETHVLHFELPESLLKFVVSKGSICLNGISLTINSITNSSLSVAIIPHTWTYTTLQFARVGDYFNLEVDVVAKYLHRFTQIQ